MAYDMLADIYFSLHKSLFPHGKRAIFTKDECSMLMDSLAARRIPGRDRRQPAQVLNRQLKDALASLPIIQLSTLQEAAKSCAMATNPPAGRAI
jgi:hypothetical protein